MGAVQHYAVPNYRVERAGIGLSLPATGRSA
jgi:hypothetical protein